MDRVGGEFWDLQAEEQVEEQVGQVEGQVELDLVQTLFLSLSWGLLEE